MLLEQTITQLDIGHTTQKRAQELGQLGYMQWLGALPAMSDYRREAMNAYETAIPLAETSEPIQVFCDLLRASIVTPLKPLALKLPERERRGGAEARRASF